MCEKVYELSAFIIANNFMVKNTFPRKALNKRQQTADNRDGYTF
jgi:hypothetical protein